MAHQKQPAITALYDGACVICRGARRAFESLDWRRRIHFVDIHDRDAWHAHSPRIGDADLVGAIHAIDERGVYAGFPATRRLLREAPLGLPLYALLHLPGMEGLGARLYRFVARRRYRVNRLLGQPLPACADEGCCAPI